jgi:hypothetical protein
VRPPGDPGHRHRSDRRTHDPRLSSPRLKSIIDKAEGGGLFLEFLPDRCDCLLALLLMLIKFPRLPPGAVLGFDGPRSCSCRADSSAAGLVSTAGFGSFSDRVLVWRP